MSVLPSKADLGAGVATEKLEGQQVRGGSRNGKDAQQKRMRA